MKKTIVTALIGAVVGYFVLKAMKATFEARKNNLGEIIDE